MDQSQGLGPGDLSVPGHVQCEQPLENVLHIVRGNHQGEVPVKFGEQQEFPFQEIIKADIKVSVFYESLRRDGGMLSNLPADK